MRKTLFFSLIILFILATSCGYSLYLKWSARPKTQMDIAFITDDNYAPHLGATIASILKNSNEDEGFNFYILENTLSTENKEKFKELKQIKKFNLRFIHVDKEKFKSLKVQRTSVETYFRYILPEVLPNKSRVLYLDADTIILSSLKELWETDISNVYAAGVKNGGLDPSKFGIEKYMNAGIILFNLDKMRQDNISEKLFKNTAFLEKEGLLSLEDQDVLNYTFQDKIILVPRKFNHPGYSALASDTVIVHFVIYKPWKNQVRNFELYYEARQLTPWKYSEKDSFFAGENWRSQMTYNKDHTRACRKNTNICGSIKKAYLIDWDEGKKEVYAPDFTGTFSRFGGTLSTKILKVKHPNWEDEMVFADIRACRLTNNDCGTIIAHTASGFKIKWDKWGEEDFEKSQKIYLFKNNKKGHSPKKQFPK